MLGKRKRDKVSSDKRVIATRKTNAQMFKIRIKWSILYWEKSQLKTCVVSAFAIVLLCVCVLQWQVADSIGFSQSVSVQAIEEKQTAQLIAIDSFINVTAVAAAPSLIKDQKIYPKQCLSAWLSKEAKWGRNEKIGRLYRGQLPEMMLLQYCIIACQCLLYWKEDKQSHDTIRCAVLKNCNDNETEIFQV